MARDTCELLRQVNTRFLPNKILLLADGGAGQEQLARWLPFVAGAHRIRIRRTSSSVKALFSFHPLARQSSVDKMEGSTCLTPRLRCARDGRESTQHVFNPEKLEGHIGTDCKSGLLEIVNVSDNVSLG